MNDTNSTDRVVAPPFTRGPSKWLPSYRATQKRRRLSGEDDHHKRVLSLGDAGRPSPAKRNRPLSLYKITGEIAQQSTRPKHARQLASPFDSDKHQSSRLKPKLERHMTEQVVPHVLAAVRSFGCGNEVNWAKLITEVTTLLMRSSRLRVRWDETSGRLEAEDEHKIQDEALHLVDKLAPLRRFWVPPRRTPEVIVIHDDDDDDDDHDHGRNGSDSSGGGGVAPDQTVPQVSAHKIPKDSVLPVMKPEDTLKPASRKHPSHSLWYKTKTRPYRTFEERRRIAHGCSSALNLGNSFKNHAPIVYHVDFTDEEVALMVRGLNNYLDHPQPETIDTMRLLNYKKDLNIPDLVGNTLSGRNSTDVLNLCDDLSRHRPHQSNGPQILSLISAEYAERQKDVAIRTSRASRNLFARELVGHAGFGQTRTYANFKDEFRCIREDDLRLITEYTNCAGDVTTVSWIGGDRVLCGATAHSDSHNQQYNKMGNLVLCSVAESKLKAYSDHRIPRPHVERGENSTAAMQQSQDRWLYSSVVSSDYSTHQDLAYTSSFDRTVKIWKVYEDPDGNSTMACEGTWAHEGNVNFVVAAKDQSNRVATAADVPDGAVRVYTLDRGSITQSPYQTYSCSRKDADGEKWAYFPATMQWGLAPGTQHLLVVGYSPRSLTNDDFDIPEEKRNTGEILLIDTANSAILNVTHATTTNVFEVAWHPNHACFIAGTSPCGLDVRRGTRTQIHIFYYDRETQAFAAKQNIDCPASDINELTIMPNCRDHSYITAACTDGKVYVWDTAHAETPMKLVHGRPIDDLMYNDREKEDTGVKFTAWGTTLDRFYTGGSDGVVRVWNIRNKKKPFVRTLLKAPGPIASGAFSPDSSRLAIGDATGRLWTFSINEEDEHESNFITLPDGRVKRRPNILIPHAEPAPPTGIEEPEVTMVIDDDNEETVSNADYARRKFLDTDQIRIHPHRTVGAVQGPYYASTGLFCREAHANMDPTQSLLTTFARNQQADRNFRLRSLRRLGPVNLEEEFAALHLENTAKEWNLENLDKGVLANLKAEGAEIEIDWTLEFEEDWTDGLSGEGRHCDRFEKT